MLRMCFATLQILAASPALLPERFLGFAPSAAGHVSMPALSRRPSRIMPAAAK
jgi:hypothetical protein